MNYTSTATKPGKVTLRPKGWDKMSVENRALIIELENYLMEQGWTYELDKKFKEFLDTDRDFEADYLCYRYIDELINGVTTQVRQEMIVEIHGGTTLWYNKRCKKCGNISRMKMPGDHNSADGRYESDLEKSNLINRTPIRYFQYTYKQLRKLKYKEDF